MLQSLLSKSRLLETTRWELTCESLTGLPVSFAWRVRTECIQSLSSDFTHRCVTSLESIGDEASSIKEYDQALAAYSIALSLGPSNPNTVLVKWVSAMLTRGSVNETLGAVEKVWFTWQS